MPTAWRIIKARHAPTAFTGRGAADHGGRWNSRGVSVVYVSSTKSLAALEILVHLHPPFSFQHAAFPVQFDEGLVETFTLKELPSNWQSEPPSSATQRIGDAWVQKARSAVLALPSVIIPSELNFLLNPAHPDFHKISIGKPEAFVFDPRLLT